MKGGSNSIHECMYDCIAFVFFSVAYVPKPRHLMAAPPSPPNVAQEIARFAQVVLKTDRQDGRRMACLCEAGKHVMEMEISRLVIAAAGAPCLMTYSSDCTPISSKLRTKRKMADHATVTREGQQEHELLVQHAFYRYIDHMGVAHTAVLLRDPLPLTHGKGAWALFSCAADFAKTLRQRGHRGTAIQHYTFDRAAFSALQRMCKQRHIQLAPCFGEPSEGTSSVLLNLQEWVVSTGCALHDAHNALKWGLHQQFVNADLMKGLYIVIESLRNSYGQVLSYLGDWIVRSLQFVPDENLPSEEERAVLWTALGLDPTLVDVLACKLRLQWNGARLQVAASCMDMPDVIETLSSALLGVWHFKKFSDSRWITVGCSCRTLIASLLTGLESLVAFIREDPASSDFHIVGFVRLSPEMKKFSAAAALASYVSDAFLSEMMEDPRLPMRLAFLKQCVQDEQQWLDSLPFSVWESMAEVVGGAARELRTDTIAAGHISMAFLQNRVFSEAEKHPWSLASGDIASNLDALATGPEPVERTARKIWRLLQLNFNRYDLEQGLQLLLDCPWSTACTEQQHASATLVRKYHHEVGTEHLLVRSLLHTMRHLVCQPNAQDKQLERLERQVAKLQSKRPQQLTARPLYFKDVVGLAKEWSDQGKQIPTNFARAIMKQHGDSWARAPESVKANYDARASVEKSAAEQALAEDIEHAQDQLLLARRRAQEQAGSNRLPLNLSVCKFSNTALEGFQILMASPMFSETEVERMRAKAAVAPSPMSAAEQQQLSQLVVEDNERPQPKPSWLIAICRLRDHFADTALAIPTESGLAFFKFIYATQSPLSAYFAPLEELTHVDYAGPITGANWEQIAMSCHGHQFTIDFSRLVPWDGLPDFPVDQLEVLLGLWYKGGHELFADATTVPFEMFLRTLPPLKEPRSRPDLAKQPHRVPAALQQGIEAEYPFLQHFLSQLPLGNTSSGSSGAQPRDSQGPGEELMPLDDEALEAAFDELHRARQAWVPNADYLGDDFKVNLLGGTWSLQTKGKSVVAWLASARTPRASNWCTQYGLYRSGRFEVSVYGEKAAQTFAKAWAHKMQFFLNLYLASNEARYRYTPGDKDAYLEPGDFTALATTLKGKMLARVDQLRSTFPLGH